MIRVTLTCDAVIHDGVVARLCGNAIGKDASTSSRLAGSRAKVDSPGASNMRRLASELRRAARRGGWRTDWMPSFGNRDICPDCQKAGHR